MTPVIIIRLVGLSIRNQAVSTFDIGSIDRVTRLAMAAAPCGMDRMVRSGAGSVNAPRAGGLQLARMRW
jgi:hypothetical protein